MDKGYTYGGPRHNNRWLERILVSQEYVEIESLDRFVQVLRLNGASVDFKLKKTRQITQQHLLEFTYIYQHTKLSFLLSHFELFWEVSKQKYFLVDSFLLILVGLHFLFCSYLYY